MEEFEKFKKNFEEKFNLLNKRISTLQDIILQMKTEFALISKNKMENEYVAEIISISEKNLDNFIDKRPKNCKLLDSCTTLIEKSTFKILRKYMNKGPSAALKLLKKYDEVSTNYIKTGKCPDEKCLDNSLKIIKSLEDIFRSSEQTFIKQTKDLFSQVNEYCMSEGTEKNECKLLSPLTNETRLKILKVLNRGGAYYTQLERNVGLKGGHFHFHLNKLINAGYISQEEEKGPYLITTRALKALKFMHDMKQEFLIENIVK